MWLLVVPCCLIMCWITLPLTFVLRTHELCGVNTDRRYNDARHLVLNAPFCMLLCSDVLLPCSAVCVHRCCVAQTRMNTTKPPAALQMNGSGAGACTVSTASGAMMCCPAGCTCGTVCWQRKGFVLRHMPVFWTTRIYQTG